MICTVTGTLKDLSGNTLANTKVTFYRSGVTGQDGAVVIPRMAEATSDNAGAISVDLYGGAYSAQTIGLNGAMVTFNVGVPDQASAVLSDLIDQTPALESSILIDAVAARDAAEGFKNDAEGAANTAAAAAVAGVQSSLQSIEADAEAHETGALAAKVAAEIAAASAASVMQQDLSALGFDVPHGAVAICPIDPYEHGFVTWPVHGKQSWRSETRATGKYLGVQTNTASAWAVTDAAAGDFFWDDSSRVYELTGTSTSVEIHRAGSPDFTARWSVAYSDRIVLLAEDGSPWMVFEVTFKGYGQSNGSAMIANLYGSSSSNNSVSGVAFVGSQLWLSRTGEYNSVDYTCANWIDFATDQGGAIGHNAANGLPSDHKSAIYNGNIANRNVVNLGAHKNDRWSDGLVANGINAVAATVLPDAPIENGVPVPTIAVATDGGVSVIRDDGTVVHPFTSYAMKEVYFTADNALRYTYTGDHSIRETRYPFESAGSGVLAAYGSFGMPTLAPRSDWAGVSRFGAYGSLGRSYHKAQPAGSPLATAFENPSNVSSGMVAYQADEYTTSPMFGDVKGAFLCEQGQAGVLAGANYLDEDFSGYADTAALQAAWVPQNGSGIALNAGVMEVTRVGETCAQITLPSTIPAGSLVTFTWEVVSNTGGSAYAYLGFDGSSEKTPNNSDYSAVGNYSHTIKIGADRSTLSVYLGGTASFTVGLDNIKIDVSHPDRSVNGKGLIINGGGLTQDVDGYIGGFNSSSFLHQPNFAGTTNDFYIAFETDSVQSDEEIITIDADGSLPQGPVGGIHVWTYNSQLKFNFNGDNFIINGLPASRTLYKGLIAKRGDQISFYMDGRLVDQVTVDDVPLAAGVLTIGNGFYNGKPQKVRRVVVGNGAPSHAQIKVMSNWVGDRLEGAFKDMAFVAETGVLHVLTDAYHYEVDADGAVLKSTPNTETWLKLSASRDGVVRTS